MNPLEAAPLALEVEEVLSLWREGERLLEELPGDAPQRKLVSAQVEELRRLYERLIDEPDVTAHMIDNAHEAIESARTVLAGARARGKG